MHYKTNEEIVTTVERNTYIGLVQVAQREPGVWHVQAAGHTYNRNYGGAIDIKAPYPLSMTGSAIPSLFVGSSRTYWPALVTAVNGDPVRLLQVIDDHNSYFEGPDGDRLCDLVREVVA